LPPALLPARRDQSLDAVGSRNPCKSTLAHDAVTAAVSHKLHSIICVGAGLIQFDHGSHSRLAADLTLDKVLFSPWFLRVLSRTHFKQQIQYYLTTRSRYSGDTFSRGCFHSKRLVQCTNSPIQLHPTKNQFYHVLPKKIYACLIITYISSPIILV